MKFNPFATELKNLSLGNKQVKQAFDAFSTNHITDDAKNAENLRQVLAWLNWMSNHADAIKTISEGLEKQVQQIADERITRPRNNFDTKYDLLKKQYPGCLYLFRCGDFYEAYKEDAVKIANILDITLCKEKHLSCYTCGFPFHCLDIYLPKLVRAGYRIAICDNIREDFRNLGYMSISDIEQGLCGNSPTIAS